MKTKILLAFLIIKTSLFSQIMSVSNQDFLLNFIEKPFIDLAIHPMTLPIIQLDEFYNKYGKPLDTIDEYVENPYDDSMDTILHLNFGDYEYSIYQVTHLEKDFLHRFTIYESERKLSNNINFSMKKEDLRKIFGDPHSIRNISGLTYVFYFYAESRINVYFVYDSKNLKYIYINSGM